MPEFLDVADNFRRAMRGFTATVTVISLSRDGARHGITATAVTSLSMNPPALVACINNGSRFYRSLACVTDFCVNVLRREQVAISQAFSGQNLQEERFRYGDWPSDEHGVPFLRGAQANIFCRRTQLMRFTSHDIVIGEVYATQVQADVAPLLYCDGNYVRAAPVPAHTESAACSGRENAAPQAPHQS
jgi:flavin reductase (DIM6/NTAB) family NADH-FMN oxidoreductase RutF